jgi:hypothetical protein
MFCALYPSDNGGAEGCAWLLFDRFNVRLIFPFISALQAYHQSTSSFLQKIDGLRWTAHMDECLQILRERKECPNDEILVELVQLQQIVEKPYMGALSDRAEESSDYGHQTSLYRDDLLSKLQGIKATLLAKSENNGWLL